MNIIFGTKEAEMLEERYIVLELDTITIKSSTPIVTYCVIENMPIDEISLMENLKKLHHNLMKEYRNKNWNFCEQAIDQLMKYWAGELDSFYEILLKRIKSYQEQDPGDDWTGIIAK